MEEGEAMKMQTLAAQKNMSMYRLSKKSGVPYMTLNDIWNGKTPLQKCTGETIYRIAQALDVSMEELLEPFMAHRPSFENYKSAVCHRLKELGDVAFLAETLQSGDIRTYYDREWYAECFYLLAMLDYISRENNVPLCTDYDDLRCCKLDKPIYPASLLARANVSKSEAILQEAMAQAIPEFVRFNIIENEVRDVV